MPKTQFAKDFIGLVEEFNVATQRAIKAFEKSAIDDDDAYDKMNIDEDDIFDGNIDRLYARTKKTLEYLDRMGKEVESETQKQDSERKKAEAEAARKKGVTDYDADAVAEERKKLHKAYEQDAKKADKALEAFTLRVRSQFVGRRDLGDKFDRAAGTLYNDLKKLDAEIDKVIAAELKRQPKEFKKAEIIPSKFLSEFMALKKKHDLDDSDPKVKKVVREVEDRLKKCDLNGDFDKVSSLCDVGMSTLKDLMKLTEKPNPKFNGAIKDLVKAIDKYDNHMFLLGRNA
jgi:hypothetical protein